jgi:hypothetical protein
MIRPLLSLSLCAPLVLVGLVPARAEDEGPLLPGITTAPSTAQPPADEPPPNERSAIPSRRLPETEPPPGEPHRRGLDPQPERGFDTRPIDRPTPRREQGGYSPDAARGRSQLAPGQVNRPNTAAPRWQPGNAPPNTPVQQRPIPEGRPGYQQHPALRGPAAANPPQTRRGQPNAHSAPPANGYRPAASGNRPQTPAQYRWNQPSGPGYSRRPGVPGEPSAPQSRTQAPYYRPAPTQPPSRVAPNERSANRPQLDRQMPGMSARIRAGQASPNPGRLSVPPANIPRAPWDAARRGR